MLTGEKVILWAVTRVDLDRLCQFQNDVAVEIASGGDPPAPHSIDHRRAILAYRACGFAEGGRLREQVYSDGRYDDQVWLCILRAD